LSDSTSLEEASEPSTIEHGTLKVLTDASPSTHEVNFWRENQSKLTEFERTRIARLTSIHERSRKVHCGDDHVVEYPIEK